MKSNKSVKKFSYLSGVTAIALCLAACGGEQSLKGDNGSAQASKAKSVRSTANGNSGLALQLPASLPKGVDTVVVNLTSDSCSLEPFGVLRGTVGGSTDKYSNKKVPFLPPKVPTKAGFSGGKAPLANPTLDVALDVDGGEGVFCGLSQTFSIKDPSSAKDGSIALNDLDPGNYRIAIDLINSETGKVYQHGEGKVVIQTGKTAKAEISMSPVADKTGNLKIVLK